MSQTEYFLKKLVLTQAQYEQRKSAGTLQEGVEYLISDAIDDITDVKVNGTSVVTNHVANIPIGSTSTLGVLKVGTENYGIKLNSGNELVTQAADDSRIVAKSNGNCPIVPNKLDKAVMEGLGNNALTWTDAYKSSARNTIGSQQQLVISADFDTLTTL